MIIYLGQFEWEFHLYLISRHINLSTITNSPWVMKFKVRLIGIQILQEMDSQNKLESMQNTYLGTFIIH
jgi:hypothetical protein